jgi:hypothetical protein
MNIMVIKFERGYRLVRTPSRRIELWHNGDKLLTFKSWESALKHLDAYEGEEVKPEAQPIHTIGAK